MQTVTMVLKLLKLSRHIEDEGIGRDGTLDTMDASDIPEGSDEDESTKIETQVHYLLVPFEFQQLIDA